MNNTARNDRWDHVSAKAVQEDLRRVRENQWGRVSVELLLPEKPTLRFGGYDFLKTWPSKTIKLLRWQELLETLGGVNDIAYQIGHHYDWIKPYLVGDQTKAGLLHAKKLGIKSESAPGTYKCKWSSIRPVEPYVVDTLKTLAERIDELTVPWREEIRERLGPSGGKSMAGRHRRCPKSVDYFIEEQHKTPAKTLKDVYAECKHRRETDPDWKGEGLSNLENYKKAVYRARKAGKTSRLHIKEELREQLEILDSIPLAVAKACRELHTKIFLWLPIKGQAWAFAKVKKEDHVYAVYFAFLSLVRQLHRRPEDYALVYKLRLERKSFSAIAAVLNICGIKPRPEMAMFLERLLKMKTSQVEV